MLTLKESRNLHDEHDFYKSKQLMRKGNTDAIVDMLTDNKVSFELALSNYSMRVESPEMNISFVATMQTKQTFAGFAKLKSNLKDKPKPDIKRDDLVYYTHDFKRNAHYDKVFNIDLKSAYVTILFNDGLITKETYDYVCKLKKQERLACVGMLASRKELYSFTKGNPKANGEKVSEYAPFFYYAVNRTYEIMNELKKILGRGRLFTWVDGIYFLPDEDGMSDCMAYLDSINFPYTVDVLTNFNVDIFPRKIKVTFYKPGKKGDEFRLFNLPVIPNIYQKALHKALLHTGHKIKRKNA